MGHVRQEPRVHQSPNGTAGKAFEPCARSLLARGDVRPLTPLEFARIASCLYPEGHGLQTIRQRLRPFICPFAELVELVPKGSVVLDVGCGGGLLLGLLHALGRLSKGHGFDNDASAIRMAEGMARRVTAGSGSAPLLIERRDAGGAWPDCVHDVVCMIDLLHHVPVRAQEGVFRRASERVGTGGLLIYKDVSDRPRWRAAVNCAHDLWMARQWIHFVPEDVLGAWARASGLELVYSAYLPRLGFGHVLRLFRRPASVGPC